jgi:hypothetical protein
MSRSRTSPLRRAVYVILKVTCLMAVVLLIPIPGQAEGTGPGARRLHLPIMYAGPLAAGAACPATGATYETIPVLPPRTDRPAALHADLNLGLRRWSATTALMALVEIAGDTDGDPPQLRSIFADRRTPTFISAAQVYDWNWNCGPDGCRGALLTLPPVTLLGLAARPGEQIRSPSRLAPIYSEGYIALVLYAEESRITLKYTREDNVVSGYTVHLEGVCVDPVLLALYRQAETAGRSRLPALRNGQPLGTMQQHELRVAVRDTGAFMDPRSRKDWWQR